MPIATWISTWPSFQLQNFESRGALLHELCGFANILDHLMAIKSMNVDLDYHHISWHDQELLVILLPLTSKKMGASLQTVVSSLCLNQLENKTTS